MVHIKYLDSEKNHLYTSIKSLHRSNLTDILLKRSKIYNPVYFLSVVLILKSMSYLSSLFYIYFLKNIQFLIVVFSIEMCLFFIIYILSFGSFYDVNKNDIMSFIKIYFLLFHRNLFNFKSCY